LIEAIQKEGEDYDANYIYNMDESGYYWKLKPDRSLSIFEALGTKKQKARITIALTYNSTGIEKLVPWFISIVVRLNCFGAARLKEINHLGAF
jgi:hypothetical protein